MTFASPDNQNNADGMASAYLATPFNRLWRWVDNGDIIASGTDRAIIARQELVLVIEPLVSVGLPNWSAIITILGVLKEEKPWPKQLPEYFADDEIVEMPDEIPDMALALWAVVPRSFRDKNAAQLSMICRSLVDMTQWHKELRTSTEAKRRLLARLFGVAAPSALPRQSRPESEEIIECLRTRQMVVDRLWLRNPPARSATDLLTTLALIFEDFDPNRWEKEFLTGVTELPVALPIPIEEKPLPSLRQRLLSWRDDEVMGPVARAALDLAAVLIQPHWPTDWDHLPLGGVSDITNRGQLDRLLLSELAHDDLTLMTRLALGEALYLRREQPQHNQNVASTILLDVGIRTWGKPRLFIVAAALAMIAVRREGDQILVFRAESRDAIEVDLTNESGLIAHLQTLTAERQPLDSFSAWRQKTEAKALANTDTVVNATIVTTPDSFHDPLFRERLAEATQIWPYLECALVTSNGAIEWFRFANSRWQSYRRIEWDPHRVFSAASKKHKARPKLPQRSRNRAPWLLRSPPQRHLVAMPSRQTTHFSDLTKATIDRLHSLWYWDSAAHGAHLITRRLPPGPIWGLHKYRGNRFLVLLGPHQRLPVRLVDLEWVKETIEAAKVHTLPMIDPQPHFALLIDDLYIVLNSDRTVMHGFSLPNIVYRGLHRTERVRHWPQLTQENNRYSLFQQPILSGTKAIIGLPYAIGLLQGKLILEPYKLNSPPFDQLDPHHLVGTFFHGPTGGPAIVKDSGQLVTCDGRVWGKSEAGAIQKARVSADGNTVGIFYANRAILFRYINDSWQHEIHLRPTPVSTAIESPFSENTAEFNVHVRRRFSAAAIDSRRGPLLYSKGQWLALAMSSDRGHIELLQVNPELVEARPLVKDHWSEEGIRSQSTSWPNGSRLVFDNRGTLLLHSESSQPDVLLTLGVNRVLAAVTSDGQAWGHDYFQPRGTPIAVADLYLLILHWWEQLG